MKLFSNTFIPIQKSSLTWLFILADFLHPKGVAHENHPMTEKDEKWFQTIFKMSVTNFIKAGNHKNLNNYLRFWKSPAHEQKHCRHIVRVYLSKRITFTHIWSISFEDFLQRHD